MSIETRSSSALFKRAEQLKRWEDSDTNRAPAAPRHRPQKVKFSSGCVFLAACAAGDKDEVLRLVEQGADIDTANVDGLTALHQVGNAMGTDLVLWAEGCWPRTVPLQFDLEMSSVFCSCSPALSAPVRCACL